MPSREAVPSWWNLLEEGDRLREIGGPRQKDDHLLHVVAIFKDDDSSTPRRISRFVVTKTWLKSRQRWNYEVQTDVRALVGSIYPDGQERPKR